VVKVDRRIRWHYTTTILRLRIGARLTRYRNCKSHNFARTISRHADGISRYSVPPSAGGPLLPLRKCGTSRRCETRLSETESPKSDTDSRDIHSRPALSRWPSASAAAAIHLSDRHCQGRTYRRTVGRSKPSSSLPPRSLARGPSKTIARRFVRVL